MSEFWRLAKEAIRDGRAATYNTATHKVVPIDAEIWTDEQREDIRNVASSLRVLGQETHYSVKVVLENRASVLARVLPPNSEDSLP